jgi:hypothetical protein
MYLFYVTILGQYDYLSRADLWYSFYSFKRLYMGICFIFIYVFKENRYTDHVYLAFNKKKERENA